MDDDRVRTALVTGGTSGIGAAVVARLAATGHRVVAAGLTADLPDDHHSALAGAEVIDTDVTDEASVVAAVRAAVDDRGRLDVLVTAAGVQRYGTATETTAAAWDEVFMINVRGTFLAVRHAIPALRVGGGSIVAVSSVQAFVTQEAVAAYSSGKAAVNALMRSVAVDEARHGVRANAVCPGSVDTPMLRAAAARFAGEDGSAADLVAEWGRMHPWGRVAAPDEVAAAVCWLAGPDSGFVTGTALPVDGGLLAKAAVVLPR